MYNALKMLKYDKNWQKQYLSMKAYKKLCCTSLIFKVGRGGGMSKQFTQEITPNFARKKKVNRVYA